MPEILDWHSLPAPLQIAPGVTAHTVEELADALLAASDKQHAAKSIDDFDDFLLACDTFNLWRMRWRLEEEIDDVDAVEALVQQLRNIVCDRRQYNQDEFGLALEATERRARFPFGLDPLQYALLLHQKQPIRVLHRDVQDPLSKQILGIAIQLQKINGTRP